MAGSHRMFRKMHSKCIFLYLSKRPFIRIIHKNLTITTFICQARMYFNSNKKSRRTSCPPDSLLLLFFITGLFFHTHSLDMHGKITNLHIFQRHPECLTHMLTDNLRQCIGFRELILYVIVHINLQGFSI